jgi:hypothetical protein
MIAEALHQEIATTIVVWVSFLVVWIIFAATRGNDTRAVADRSQPRQFRAVAKNSLTRPAPIAEDLRRIAAVVPDNKNKLLVDAKAQGPFEFCEWL